MFDYVIVGGGSAGCVLAARLAEDPGTRVLLLEAGPSPDDVDEIHVPAAYNRLFRTKYDWNYVTLPQERADARPVYWPRGRVLGGSSAMNAMIYIRGNRLDYDAWRDDFGCTGWGFREMAPYFLRAEDNARGAERLSRHGRAAVRSGSAPQVRTRAALHRGGHPARCRGQRRLQRGRSRTAWASTR